MGCRLLQGHSARRRSLVRSDVAGEVAVRYVTDRDLGTIDFYLSSAPGIEVPAFSRVVPNGDGAEYIFTQFQVPGISDDVFEAQVSALKEELIVLRAIMHAQAACRT